ncbi:MAG: protein-disulfide isomerase [Gammaproteobacteria bacterium]|nr:MAG: protein-disulfide isomerase [Gammaproteobacteria bacterium]
MSGIVQSDVAQDKSALIKQKLASVIPDLQIKSIADSALPGIFEVASDLDQVLYVTEDANHFFAGDLYRVSNFGLENLTEKRRETARAALLKTVPDSEMVIFAPKDVKATINVFTDIDCFYCRKFHNEVPLLNKYGIQVNYLAYPRAGIGSKSYDKIVSTWCAKDRKATMTLAKQGKQVPPVKCDNPVATQFELGHRMGVTGTPAIFFESGRLIRGYMPADKMAKSLGLL